MRLIRRILSAHSQQIGNAKSVEKALNGIHYSGLPCRAESCAATVSDSGPSRLPWGRDIGSTHGVLRSSVHHHTEESTDRSVAGSLCLGPRLLLW